MSALSDYAENKLLDHLLGTAAFTMPTQVYLGLFTAAPSDSGGGTEVSTAGGSLYGREAVDFNAASGGAANPTALIAFDPAGTNWGTITHVGLFDAATGGNLLMHGALAAGKLIEIGDTFTMPAADLDTALA